MPSIFDFLKRLFSRRRPATRPPAMAFGGAEPAEALIADAPDAATTPFELPAPPPPAVEAVEAVEDEEAEGEDEERGEDEDEEEPDDLPEDEIEEDPLAPDPFISPDAPSIEALSPESIALRRAEAMALASQGEHRVFLAEPAGPGSLAEALDDLAQQGKVAAEFHEDPDEGPYLLYRAVADASDQPPPSAL